MSEKQFIKLFDGWTFKLSPEQIDQIQSAIVALQIPEHQGRAALVGQVWVCEDGTFCCVRLLEPPMAHAIKACLGAYKIEIVAIDQPGGPPS